MYHQQAAHAGTGSFYEDALGVTPSCDASPVYVETFVTFLGIMLKNVQVTMQLEHALCFFWTSLSDIVQIGGSLSQSNVDVRLLLRTATRVRS